MNRLIIKKIPIENKDHQVLDIDIEQMKNEVQNSMKDYALEHMTYSVSEEHITLLFVMRQFTSKGIGFRTSAQ
jgi:hypothetical protein